MAKSIKNDDIDNVFVTEKFSDAFQTHTHTLRYTNEKYNLCHFSM